ncbi:MAG TPA: c(7)-type cytochrome triheme domain-containing protein [Noviherbaspirillum sp.]|nr:c(7)-type cytochrome triheme domain-containing protein [Noviherbaspirillum sp.]
MQWQRRVLQRLSIALVTVLALPAAVYAQIPGLQPTQRPLNLPYPVQLQLSKDGLHDTANSGIKMLQEPREGLAHLPKDYPGNGVNWVKALRDGVIQPRTNILPETKIEVLDLDILLSNTGEMPMVLFPHRQHTEWLDCSNCHDRIFAKKKGGTKGLNMFAVLQGEFCGQCHGAVAFPLTECNRCHSKPRK